MKLKKNTTIRQRSKSMAVCLENTVFSQIENVKSSPKKLDGSFKNLDGSSQKQQSRIFDDNLTDSIKMTPAKPVSTKKKSFIHLFCNGNDGIEIPSESEDEEATGEETVKKVIIETNNFNCEHCEYHAKFPNHYKDHLQKEHGQQRPRIYSCPCCPKSFGVLKSMKDHLLVTHKLIVETVSKAKSKDSKSEGKQKVDSKPKEPKTQNNKQKEVKSKAKKLDEVTEIKAKDTSKEEKSISKQVLNKTQDTSKAEKSINKQVLNKTKDDKDNETQEERNVASFKALNESLMKKRMFENVVDSDYTFAINGSSASTPRAESSDFQCDICDCELTTAKQMQDHMKTAHAIEKPKIFKCTICDKSLTTKQSLNKHTLLHSDGADVGKSTKRKILQEEEEEEEVVNIESIFQTNNSADDDEGPREEKILKVNDTMSAPGSPIKKERKSKSSLLDISVGTTNGESPSKAEKRKKQKKSEELTSDQLMEEINHNVKPHKKARLDSTADESVSDFSCDKCGKRLKTQQSLEQHVQKKHSVLKCTNCKNTYTSQVDYVGHFSECGPSDDLPCGVFLCKKSFSEANFLSSHLRKRHKWV
uniref:Zinc finger protein CG2199 n=1 Tax=Drosophila rhopaloa TaxID=1041015 RepID=A0A6P4F510_DRORH